MMHFAASDFINPDENIRLMLDQFTFDSAIHTHDFIELVYVLNGFGVHEINGINYQVEQGDMLFINAGQTHKFTSSEGRLYVNFLINPKFVASELLNSDNFMDFLSLSIFSEFQGQIKSCIPLIKFDSSDKDETEFIVKSMMKEFEQKRTGYKTVLKSYLTALFAKMFRQMQIMGESNQFLDIGKVADEIKKYIDSNYCRKITLKQLAEKTFYNPSYFSRMFKQCYGKTLTEYIQEKRMHEAKKLLSETDWSIEKICHTVGYANKTAFYNVFKSQYLMTPKEFREKLNL